MYTFHIRVIPSTAQSETMAALSSMWLTRHSKKHWLVGDDSIFSIRVPFRLETLQCFSTCVAHASFEILHW